MKYLKKFNQASEYEAFKVGDEYITPNVSYVENSNEVMFAPAIKTLTYNMVDLGLPSGTLWCDRNVGATSPEDYGLYFQWGDTVGWTVEQVTNGEKAFSYDWSDYFDTTDGGNTFNKYNKDKLTRLEASDDAATVNMGSEYRMPTSVEMEELLNNTTFTYIDLQGNEFNREDLIGGAIAEYNLKGVRFTGSNGNSIFIPTSGDCYESTLEFTDQDCNIWSSDLYISGYSRVAITIYFNTNSFIGVDTYDRCLGLPVRGVK